MALATDPLSLEFRFPMRDDRFQHRWRGKALYTAMWGLLRVGAIRQGIDPGKLERVRAYLKFRYHLDHPRPADPFQRPRHFFPGLAARPWHEAADFAWTAPIDESAETIRKTLTEVDRCTRDGIRINTFMLDASPGLRGFVERMTKMNRGRAFFTTPETLGDYVLVDFVEQKRRSRRAG